MNYENKQILIKRTKSFIWRTGMMCLAMLVSFLSTNLDLFQMPAELTLVLGLILGEVSKQLNSK